MDVGPLKIAPVQLNHRTFALQFAEQTAVQVPNEVHTNISVALLREAPPSAMR